MSKLRLDKEWLLFGLMIVVLLLAPTFLSDFRLSLLAKFLTYAIVAISLDLLWGYGGMLSLGQGVFFGLGAYSMAMYLKLMAAGSALPDFMVWSGLTELPWFWKPFHYAWFAIGASVIIPAMVAAIIGFVIFRSRIRGVYFSILTQALALVITILLVGQQPYTGGTNGITNFSTILGFSLSDTSTQTTLYFITVICLACVYILCRWLTGSRFGRILIAIRDAEARVRFCGYNTVMFKVFTFALSAGLAGLGGALFVPQVGIISPAMIGVVPSIEMVIWVAVGGRGTLIGAILGALIVNGAKSYLSESFPDAWLYLQGLLFIAVILLVSGGVMGIFKKLNKSQKITGSAIALAPSIGKSTQISRR
nr:urea ABC transporter permease subunit UrtC [Calderihabitans maritimus]